MTNNKINRDTEHAAMVIQTARITGVSKSLVQKVIRGDRKNENVMSCYMDILENGYTQNRFTYLKRVYGPLKTAL